MLGAQERGGDDALDAFILEAAPGFFCLRDAFFGEVDIRESADAVCSVHGCFAVACDVQFHLTTPFTLFPRCCKAAFRCLPSRGRGL